MLWGPNDVVRLVTFNILCVRVHCLLLTDAFKYVSFSIQNSDTNFYIHTILDRHTCFKGNESNGKAFFFLV